MLLVVKNAMYWVENVKYQQEYFSLLAQGTASDVEERLLFLGREELAGAKGLNALYAKGLSRTQLVSQDSLSFPCRWWVRSRCQFINGASAEGWVEAGAMWTGGSWVVMPLSLVLPVCFGLKFHNPQQPNMGIIIVPTSRVGEKVGRG